MAIMACENKETGTRFAAYIVHVLVGASLILAHSVITVTALRRSSGMFTVPVLVSAVSKTYLLRTQILGLFKT